MASQFVIVQIPGRPQAKGRPRFTASGHVYTDARTRNAEMILQAFMREQCPSPLGGPLELGISFCFRRPNSWRKARREAVDNGAEPWYMGKPDVDNLVKTVMDAANKILWQDDSQIVDLRVTKVYSATDETLINVIEVTDAGAS